MGMLSRLLVLPAARGLRTSAVAKGGHAPVFEFRKDMLTNRRIFDHMHFYVIGIGFLPWFVIAGIQAVVSGRCRLEPLPTDRVPRYWEYEDTPLKQLRAFLMFNPQKAHEVALSTRTHSDIKQNFRKRVKRMEHVTMQRLDYDAWWHQPIKSAWVERSKDLAEHMSINKDLFRHSFTGTASIADTTVL